MACPGATTNLISWCFSWFYTSSSDTSSNSTPKSDTGDCPKELKGRRSYNKGFEDGAKLMLKLQAETKNSTGQTAPAGGGVPVPQQPQTQQGGVLPGNGNVAPLGEPSTATPPVAVGASGQQVTITDALNKDLSNVTLQEAKTMREKIGVIAKGAFALLCEAGNAMQNACGKVGDKVAKLVSLVLKIVTRQQQLDEKIKQLEAANPGATNSADPNSLEGKIDKLLNEAEGKTTPSATSQPGATQPAPVQPNPPSSISPIGDAPQGNGTGGTTPQAQTGSSANPLAGAAGDPSCAPYGQPTVKFEDVNNDGRFDRITTIELGKN